MWRLATAVLLVVTGCSDGGTSGGGHWDPLPPALLAVGVVDSFGEDSEEPGALAPELDFRENNGWFELYWYADAYDSYTATVRLSRGGRSMVIGEYQCGPYDLCYDSASLHCLYTREFYLGCDFYSDDAKYYAVPIAGLLDDMPEDALLHVEICDDYSSYCESGALPVVLY